MPSGAKPSLSESRRLRRQVSKALGPCPPCCCLFVGKSPLCQPLPGTRLHLQGATRCSFTEPLLEHLLTGKAPGWKAAESATLIPLTPRQGQWELEVGWA